MPESYSSHPIARAIVAEYAAEPVQEKIESYQELPGLGIRLLYDGREILVGNDKLLREYNINNGIHLYNGNGTVVYVVIDKEFAGYIILTDVIREDAHAAMSGLRELGVREPIMLTGGPESCGRRICFQAGTGCPLCRINAGRKGRNRGKPSAGSGKGKLLFAGDGINDAPVLARADIGCGHGRGRF